MGGKVDLIEEIRNRIATDNAGTLSAIQKVFIGPSPTAINDADYPFVAIWPESGDESSNSQPNRDIDDMIVRLKLVTSQLQANSENILFKTSDSSGSFYLFEDLLDTIMTNTSGTVDTTLSSTLQEKPVFSYDIEYLNDTIVYNITMSCQIKQFDIGGR